MSNFPQKRQVNVAIASKRPFDLSHAHATTIDFGRIKTIENRYMVPGDEFKCNIRSITQVLSQLPSPTFGSFNVTFRGYFVPIRTIWSPFYDFIKNQLGLIDQSFSEIYYPPYATCKDFVDVFKSSDFSTVVSNPITRSEYDFALVDSTTSVTTYYKFTKLGKVAYDFCVSNRCNISFNNNDSNEKINVLPLVAFWKTYFDWIIPSRFIPEHEDNIELLISYFTEFGNYRLSVSQLKDYILKEPLSYYMDDIITSCTEYPFSSNINQDNYHISNPSDIFSQSNDSYSVDADTALGDTGDNFAAGAYMSRPVDEFGFINMYSLQTLGKLQDLLNRNLIAGSKVQDWLLTEFGMRPSADALHLSTYLGSRQNSMAITDILSTADTAAQGGVGLGSYGGKLKERFDFDFDYKAKEHGYFIITFELVPRTSYYQAKEPEYNMLDRFDFFQPEFDNQQGAPITHRDLFFDAKDGQSYQSGNTIFGFNLQYARLKTANDVVSGDFRNRFGLSLKSWFLARDMDKYSLNSSGTDVINEEFCLVKNKYQNWNYIFSDTSDELDHFVCFFYFDMPCMRPMKSITEGFEPTYKNSNKDVSIDFQGSVK